MKNDFFERLKITVESKKGITYINESIEDEFISYNETFRVALWISKEIKRKHTTNKTTVIIQATNFKEFIPYYIGCLLAEVTPVPLYLTRNIEQSNMLLEIMRDIEESYLLTSSKNYRNNLLQLETVKNEFENYVIEIPNNLYEINNVTEEELKSYKYGNKDEEDIAYLQFSSGSTAKPKGVIITYKNLLNNLNIINSLFDVNENSRLLGWVPLEHNIGLVLFLLTSIFNSCNLYLINTLKFMQNPMIWIKKLSEYKINLTASTNFGLEYCIKSQIISEDSYLDLSNLKYLICGSEIVSVNTCKEFEGKFKDYGLNTGVITPSYGMSESTLGISVGKDKNGIKWEEIESNNMIIGEKIKNDIQNKFTRKVISLGKPIDGCNVRITNDEGNILEETYIGNIEVLGEGITRGYYNNEIENLKSFTKDKWLKTGDIGFIKDNNVYIIGRKKEMTIINGKNIYFSDIENVIKDIMQEKGLNIIISSIYNEENKTEKCIAFVLGNVKENEFYSICKLIYERIREKINIKIYDIALIHNAPRTGSGKIQRYKLIDIYNRREFFLNYYDKLNEDKELNENEKVFFNTIEESVINVIRKVLKSNEVWAESDFFKLGGSSLDAAKIILELNKLFNIELQIEDIFIYSNIDELCEYISELINS